MAANSASSVREARRRRIVDRGSDRLALITGRIQTLPSSSEPSDSLISHTESYPPSISHHQDFPTNVLPQCEDKTSSSLLGKHDSGTETGQVDANDGGGSVRPSISKCEISTEASRAAALERDRKMQSSLEPSTVKNSSISTPGIEHHFERRTNGSKYFTLSQISSAITSSESIRTYCSLVAAVLVVLSYVGFPIFGSSIIKSLIISRPLYLVLLTNVSIVLARLLLGKQSKLQGIEHDNNNVPLEGRFGFAEQVGKALEAGLLLQNIMGAVFMDCSVYAVVVICGLSLAHRLGW